MLAKKTQKYFHREVDTHSVDSLPKWRAVFWLYSVALPVLFYLFEALKISAYWTAKAPNVDTNIQLVLMLGFYGIWICVPWLIWKVSILTLVHQRQGWRNLLMVLGFFGLVLSCIHLMLLAIIQRIMYFPPDNPNRGLIHLIHTFGETWFDNAAIWLVAYCITSAGILFAILPQDNDGTNTSKPKVSRYEVRQNGKTWSVAYTDIFWIKAAGNYTELHTVRGVLMVRKTLSRVAEEITSDNFLRSHRSALVNGHHVVAIKPQKLTSGFIVQLANDEEAPLSRRKLSEFRRRLKHID